MKKVLSVVSLITASLSFYSSAQQDNSQAYAGVGIGRITVPDVDGINFSDANNGFFQLGYEINENISIEGQYSKSFKDASASYSEVGTDVSEFWWDSIVSLNPGVTMADAQSWYPYVEADMELDLDATIETAAIYGVYRSSGDFYFKAKAGYLREKSTLSIRTNAYSLTAYVQNGDPFKFSAKRGDESFEALDLGGSGKIIESESSFSGGLGLGYRFTKVLFTEFEYTVLNDDLDLYSLSFNYRF